MHHRELGGVGDGGSDRFRDLPPKAGPWSIARSLSLPLSYVLYLSAQACQRFRYRQRRRRSNRARRVHLLASTSLPDTRDRRIPLRSLSTPQHPAQRARPTQGSQCSAPPRASPRRHNRTMYHRPAASLSELIHDYSYNYERQLSDELAGIESPRQYLSKRSPADKASSSRPAKVASGETTDDGNYNPPSAASFYIPSLPGLSAESTLTLYGGHIPSTVTAAGTGSASSATDSVVVESDAHLFFFLARAKHIAEKQKLILWLNGGRRIQVALQTHSPCPYSCEALFSCTSTRPGLLVVRRSLDGDRATADGRGQERGAV